MSLEMKLMLPELFLPIQDILATILLQNSISEEELNLSLQLENSAISDVAHEGWAAHYHSSQQ